MADLDDKILQELLQTFRGEGAEYIQTMNQSLLRMERAEGDDERKALLEEGFRAAHSMKGAARAVNLLTLEELTHDIESVLQRAHRDELKIDATIADILYDSFDMMEVLISGEEADISDLQARLQDAIGVEAKLADEEAEVLYNKSQRDTLVAQPADTGETIRVSVDKLDDLMAQVGELLVAKISAEQRLLDVRQMRLQMERWPKIWREIKMLLPNVQGETGKHLSEILYQYSDTFTRLTKGFESLDQSINRDARRLEMVANTLQDRVRRVRMVPFNNLGLVLERTVRDAARAGGKDVEFAINGRHVEVDKKVLETLKDPLVHIVRNAVYHGIETPDERQISGKPGAGCVQIDVQQRGNEVRLIVSDDGRGFDVARLRRTLAMTEDRLLADEETQQNEAIEIAFMPGVSTADDVNEIAGRGIGLDIVRQHIESIRGRINVETSNGQGTSFIITAPTSLAITRALLVRVQQERYVIPLLSIEKIVLPDDVSSVSGKTILTVDQERFPLHSLAAILERPLQEESAKQLALIISVGAQRIAILVDDVITEVELSVMPLGEPLTNVRNVLGAALMGNGDPVLMLSPADLVKSARGTQYAPLQALQKKQAEAEQGPLARVLVVDDSITTRTLEKNILLMQGYDVTTATNGREALQALGQGEYDIIISDVQMPHMSGIELARAIRADAKYDNLPLVLVTSLESKEDRERGLNAGANAYIVKRGFNQEELLKTIQQLI